MKRIITLLMFTFSAQVFAGQIPTVKSQRVTRAELLKLVSRFSTPATSAPSMAKPSAPLNRQQRLVPIRDAAFKTEIFKFTIRKGSDGTYEFSSEQVCITSGIAPVYDARFLDGAFGYPQLPDVICHNTVGGAPAEILVNGGLFLYDMSIFSDEPLTSHKVGIYQMLVKVGGNTNQIAMGNIPSRGVDTRSLVGYMFNNGGMQSCTETNDGSGDMTCTILEGEFFSGTMELLD